MVFASSVTPECRANLRRLRAEFEAAFDAMDGVRDPASPAFRAADACEASARTRAMSVVGQDQVARYRSLNLGDGPRVHR